MVEELISCLRKAEEELEKHYELMDSIFENCDKPFSDALALFEKQNKEKKTKLNKKQRTEAFSKLLQERMPNFSKALREFDALSEALDDAIEQSKSKLATVQEKLEEIEYLQEEIEEKKRDLDF